MNVKQLTLGMMLTVAAAGAMACPAGTHLSGGTGAHHKGGQCVKTASAASAKSAAKVKDTAKADVKKAKKEKKVTKG